MSAGREPSARELTHVDGLNHEAEEDQSEHLSSLLDRFGSIHVA